MKTTMSVSQGSPSSTTPGYALPDSLGARLPRALPSAVKLSSSMTNNGVPPADKAPGGGTTVTAAASTATLSRHDLILEEDLARVIEAYLAVDEHRRMRISVSEAEEILRLVNVKADGAAITRARSSADDDVQVVHLKRTGLSSQIALQADARYLIGSRVSSPLSPSTNTPQSGRRASAFVPHRRASVRGQHASQQQRKSSATALSDAHNSVSFLSLVRLFFPSYPRKVVERAAVSMLPTPPLLPPDITQDEEEQVRVLFRRCLAMYNTPLSGDINDVSVTVDELMKACPGMNQEELEALALRHCSAMREYLIHDLQSFEQLRVYDLLKHAGVSAMSFQGKRFVPPLSMISLLSSWDVLRPQLMTDLTIADQSRLSQLVVFMQQHGPAAAFRVSWPPVADDPPPPKYNVAVECTSGVDGLSRPRIDAKRIKLTLRQVACLLAAPHHAPVVFEPFYCPATQQSIAEGTSLSSVSQLRGGTTDIGEQDPSQKKKTRVLRLAHPGLCMHTQGGAAEAIQGTTKGTDVQVRRPSQARLPSSTNNAESSRCSDDMEEQYLLTVLNATPCRRGSSAQPTALPQTQSPTSQKEVVYPSQSAIRLKERHQFHKRIEESINQKFKVPLVRVVEALPISAYHMIPLRSNEGDHTACGEVDRESLVLTPRESGTCGGGRRPLSSHQRLATPALLNFSGAAPPKVPTRPASAKPIGPFRSAGDGGLCHAVSRPLKDNSVHVEWTGSSINSLDSQNHLVVLV